MPSTDEIEEQDRQSRAVHQIARQIEADRHKKSDRRNDKDDTGTKPEDDVTVHSSKWGGLFIRWICDEGHKLKNCRTQNAISIEKLYAPKKWIVTATPMINRVEDLLG